MKLKTSPNKVYIIFFTIFLIIPAILTFETLPLWEENKSSSSLPNPLGNSEIIDYAINNKTNEIMYFAKGEKYFFYIKGKTYDYTLDEEIKYFNSPLIENSGNYYFCSNLKNIIKMTSKGQFEVIQNPDCLNEYSKYDYQLKCFFHSNNNIISVAFLNTKCVNSYDITKSDWIGQGTYADQGIIDANVFNIENYDSSFAIGILFKRTSQIVIHVYNYNDTIKAFIGKYHLGFDGDLYSKNLFTFGFRDKTNKGFIFTYEPRRTNEYNFIYLNIEGQHFQSKEGKYYLTIFREAAIYDAFFIENTPILIYVIKKQERDTTFNFYLGAVDIETLIILYNIKLDNYKKVYFDYGNAYSDKKNAFLRYFENGKEIKICPFIYDSLKDTCQLFPDYNKYYYFDDSMENKTNSMDYGCPNIDINHYCVNECPKGLGKYKNNITDICIFCFTINEKFLYADNRCVDHIPYDEYYVNESHLFYNCKDKNNDLKYFYFNCYESCSEIYGITKEDNENECQTCYSKGNGLIYYNDTCVESCEEEGYAEINMTINGITYKFCQKCKITGKYYYDHKCYDKCPYNDQVYNSENICRFCGKNTYYENGVCVPKCEKGYETIKKDVDEIDCIFCKDFGKFYTHKNICEDKCDNYTVYDVEDNICYYCSEKNNGTDLIYFQNNTCVENCSNGYEKDDKNLICKFCHDIGAYFFGGECISKCPENLGWDLNDNICVNCSDFKLVLKDNRCETTCGTYYRGKNDICMPCSNFFFEYECVETCPKNTILVEGEKYCQICNGKIQNEKCVDECSYGYVINKTNVEGKNIIVEKCVTCNELNSNFHFNGKECVEDCPIMKYEEGNYCRLCFCGFSNYNCSKKSDQCNECFNNYIDGYIFGNNCEFCSKKKEEDRLIIHLGSVISSKKSFFAVNLNNIDINLINSIKWRLFIDNLEITNLNNFAAGVNEKIFIINSDVLQPGDNEVFLELNITKENNFYILEDSLHISIQLLNQNRDISLTSVEGINKVMDNSFELDTRNLIGIDEYKFYYRLLIKDEHNEIIPIKKRKELDLLIDKQQQKINLMLPIFKNFYFELSNNREERYIASNISKKYENSNIKYNNLEKILKEDNLDNYNEIEKIFLIMKYLDINKKNNLNLSDEDYEKLFNFIQRKLNDTINGEGYFESEESNETNYSNETNTYHINYYEPKTIFSLMNKLFLKEKENIPDENYNKIINIFKDFLDSLLTNTNNIKLDNSNILSFFRTFDHFVSIYINKEKITNKEIINKKSIFDILNKLSEYLLTDTYSGESIKLVGKKISLFLSHFGEYQNHLSFASIYNISDKLKYDDYNTFSFDNYNLNEEACSDDGDILLCIQNKNYKDFKEKIGNIEDYILSLCIINTNKDNYIQNENEGNSFQMKIMNSKDLNKTYNDLGFFYDIEFPFNYIPSTSSDSENNIAQLYLQQHNNNNIKKDYSNIACIPKNNLKNKDLYCLTYFNYEENLIKCSCNVMDEITYVNNPDLAKFYKELQSEGKFKTYKPLNKFSLYAVFGLLGFLLLPNFIYLLYEIKNDIKKAKYKLFNYTKKIKDKYLSAKALNNTSIFSFSILSFIYKFPFLSPLRNCNIQTPKYIKHFIITLALSYGIITSLILFLLYYPFKEKKEIIDKRDIKNQDYEVIDSHIIFKYFNSGIVFSFFGLIISIIFIYIFGIILKYNKDELKYWKNMKTLFDNYISNHIKKEVLLGSSWKKIKLRMLAYYTICGKYILGKKIKKRKINQNLDKYLKTSQARKRDNDNDNQLLPLDFDEEMRELSEKNSHSGKYRPPSIDNKNDIINDSNAHLIIGAINDTKNSIILDLQIVSGEKFQLYGANVKVDKSIEKNKKYERIKNKYICKKPNTISLEEEMEYPESRGASIEIKKFYKNLTIEYENNLSFVAIKEFIINQALTKKSNKKWISTYSSMNYKLEGYWLLVNISLILTILLLVLIFLMFRLLKLFLNDFGNFIIFVWVCTSIIIYIIVYPLLYYIKILIGSILLFKCYHLRNKIFGKFWYWVFVDKTMIYIFKVRNYITKYKKEFDY